MADRRIWGSEIETSVSPVPNFTVSFNGAYTREKVTSLGGVSFGPGVPAPVATAAQVNLPSPLFAVTFSASWTLPFQPAGGVVVLNGALYKIGRAPWRERVFQYV